MPCPVFVPHMNLKTKWKLFVELHEHQRPHHIGAFCFLFVRNAITWQLYIYVRRNVCFGITYAKNWDFTIVTIDISVKISFLKDTQYNKTDVTCKFTDIGSFFFHFLIPAFGSNFLYTPIGKERSTIFPRGRVRNSHLSLHESELLATPSTLRSERKVCIQVEWRREFCSKKLLSF